MDFFLNDLYPNQGFFNTRTQTIPEADDKKALAEDEKPTLKTKVSPTQKSSIWVALVVFLVVAVVLGVIK